MATFLLQHLADVIDEYLTSQDQWELLHSTILTILQHHRFNGGKLIVDSEV